MSLSSELNALWLFGEIKPLHSEMRLCAISFIWMLKNLLTLKSTLWFPLLEQSLTFNFLCRRLPLSASAHRLPWTLKQYYVISHWTKQANKPRRQWELHWPQRDFLKYNIVIKMKQNPNSDTINSTTLHGRFFTMEWPTMKTGRSGWRDFIRSMCCRESLM